VTVTVPPQQITNETVRFQVFEGQLAEIMVRGNRFFSSNNIMRALPSLQTGIILNGPVFQAELDRANANQDRQIYPQLEPGAETNTTMLDLKVKDRLPLHAKLEFNNQNSPGTPDLRLNSSAVYNNLWQLEHSLGVQYSFSPGQYKPGDQWNFYDRPLVANYSAFYRLPIGSPDSLSEAAAGTGAFGYDEATRKFRLPASSGQPELNFYASGSAIDTSLMTVFHQILYNTNGNSLERRDVQDDLTINQNLGGRFSVPFAPVGNFRANLSGGMDYKTYDLQSHKTNIFTLTSIVIDNESNPGHPITNINVSVVNSPVPPPDGLTHTHLDYLPLALHYDGSLRDALGALTFGVGLSLNAWNSGGVTNLHKATSSREGNGGWLIVTPGLSRDIVIHTNWVLTLHADGQWASEPLISNEQYGAGGVNSVRGYHEGEVFGDNGWRVGFEQKTPAHLVGMVAGKQPLTIRGSVFMDYAETYLIDPHGREGRVPLWGAGFGLAAAVGFHWDARFLFSWPLESTLSTTAGQPHFNFSVMGQF
jgi:hemolysin activation/secretion protein